MSLSPFDSFQSRFVTYLLKFPRRSFLKMGRISTFGSTRKDRNYMCKETKIR